MILHKSVRTALKSVGKIPGVRVELKQGVHKHPFVFVTWPDGTRKVYGGNRNDVTAKALRRDAQKETGT